jgi:hypothetical protein
VSTPARPHPGQQQTSRRFPSSPAQIARSARVRIRSRHAPTIAYIERRTAEGLSKRDIIRCLKRYIAREVFTDIQRIMQTHGADRTGVIAA